MKSFKFFSTMLILLMMSVSMVSCGSDDDEEPSTGIVGTWKTTEGTLSLTVTFNNGGTGSFAMADSEYNQTVTEAFEYVFDEDDKTLTIIGSSFEGVYNVVMTANTLRLQFYEYGDLYYYEFKRV